MVTHSWACGSRREGTAAGWQHCSKARRVPKLCAAQVGGAMLLWGHAAAAAGRRLASPSSLPTHAQSAGLSREGVSLVERSTDTTESPLAGNWALLQDPRVITRPASEASAKNLRQRTGAGTLAGCWGPRWCNLCRARQGRWLLSKEPYAHSALGGARLPVFCGLPGRPSFKL